MRGLTKLFDLRVASERSSVTAFMKSAMISARHRAYAFLAMEDVKTLRQNGWYHDAFDCVRSILPKLFNSFMATKAIAYVSIGFGVFFPARRKRRLCTLVSRLC